MIVTDLMWIDPYDTGEQYGDPLVAALEHLGADVLVEGDRGGEGTIVADVQCAGAPPELAADVASYAAIPARYDARPPWHPDGLTDQQRRARVTHLTLAKQQIDLLTKVMEGDPEMDRLGKKLAAARSSDTIEATQQLVVRRLAGRDLDLDGAELDPVVATWFVVDQARLGTAPDEAEDRERGAYLGPLVPQNGRRRRSCATSAAQAAATSATRWSTSMMCEGD